MPAFVPGRQPCAIGSTGLRRAPDVIPPLSLDLFGCYVSVWGRFLDRVFVPARRSGAAAADTSCRDQYGTCFRCGTRGSLRVGDLWLIRSISLPTSASRASW